MGPGHTMLLPVSDTNFTYQYLHVFAPGMTNFNLHVDSVSWSAQAAITEYHRLGSLNNRNLFSQFWRLEVQDQGACKVGFILRLLFLAYRQLQSCYVLTCPHM